MNGLNRTLRWFTAVVCLVAMSSVPALADLKKKDPKMTPATDKNTAVPAVPRAIPMLTPYWAYDPPANSLFDANKLTFSGDLRVRPELRTNGSFGLNGLAQGTAAQPNVQKKSNDFYVQQWMRLGINYSLSPDVEVFIQPQYAKNWGAAALARHWYPKQWILCGAGICANDPFNVATGESFFVRQAFVLIRNAGIENLSVKLGRQLVVFGNHRLFGHFDWANTGFSQDAATLQYASKIWNFTGGWGRPSDKNFSFAGTNSTEFGVAPPGVNGPTGLARTSAANAADFFFARFQVKPNDKIFKGLVIEPMWVYFINGGPSTGTAAGVNQAHAPNQNRHTIGSRFAYKKKIFDANAEGYYQFGSMGVNPGNSDRSLRINAYAGAFHMGFTLPVPMQPRIGGEVNIASGDGEATKCNSHANCGGSSNTFEQLYPTNHILFGYMDLFAWKNMVSYGGNFQMRPTKNSHFEIWGNVFRKQNHNDNWYRAAQNTYFRADGGACATTNDGVCGSSSLGQEIDVIYTMFFKNNKVGWQVGYGHFFAGSFLEQYANADSVTGQDWAYTQVHVNF